MEPLVYKVFACGIIADQPTSNGSIYTRQALETAVKVFNTVVYNKPSYGAVIDRMNLEKNEPITHVTQSLFFNESGVLCARMRLIDKKLAKDIEDGLKVIARPIISVPILEIDRKPIRVTNINKIIRVQLEKEDESERGQNQD